MPVKFRFVTWMVIIGRCGGRPGPCGCGGPRPDVARSGRPSPFGCGKCRGPVIRRVWPDGSGGVMQGACVPVECRSPCRSIKIEGLDCSCGWRGGPVSESLGFLGFWCIL